MNIEEIKEIFRETFTGKKKASDDGGCVYRYEGEDETVAKACAVGCLLSDEAVAAMEEKYRSIDHLDGLAAEELEALPLSIHQLFLLQETHDEWGIDQGDLADVLVAKLEEIT